MSPPTPLPHKVLVALGLASATACGDSCVQEPHPQSDDDDRPWFEDDDDGVKVRQRTRDRDDDDRNLDLDDGKVGPCLDVEDTGVGPCLEMLPCLSPVDLPEMKPCLGTEAAPPDHRKPPLDVCLSIIRTPPPPSAPDDGSQGQVMPQTSPDDALARLLEKGVLPADVVARLGDGD